MTTLDPTSGYVVLISTSPSTRDEEARAGAALSIVGLRHMSATTHLVLLRPIATESPTSATIGKPGAGSRLASGQR